MITLSAIFTSNLFVTHFLPASSFSITQLGSTRLLILPPALRLLPYSSGLSCDVDLRTWMGSSSAHSLDSQEHDQSLSHSTFFYDNEASGSRDDTLSASTDNTNKMSVNGAPEVSATQRMISATWGSLATSLLVTPLDVVRVRLQSQTKPSPAPLNLSRFPAYATTFERLPPDLGVKACCKEVFFVGDNGQFCLVENGHTSTAAAADCAVEETQRRTFTSTLDGIRKIARNEGVWTLWRGLSPTLAMAIPANVIYFTGYDWLRYSNTSPIKRLANDTYNPLISGAVARVAAAIVVSPIEMFRTRMQASSGNATGLMKDTLVGLQTMTQTQGYTSLWRGLTLTMWRDVPFSGIYWWGYESLRQSFAEARDSTRTIGLGTSQSTSNYRESQLEGTHTTTFVDSFAAGAISGGFSAFITTPFDVGKTRRQVYMHAGDEAGSATAVAVKEAAQTAGKVVPEELPMLKFLYHIFKEEGMNGLFKGWGARCLKVAPACAIMISSYEVGKKFAHTSNTRKEDRTKSL